jgi:hypothetical protein
MDEENKGWSIPGSGNSHEGFYEAAFVPRMIIDGGKTNGKEP